MFKYLMTDYQDYHQELSGNDFEQLKRAKKYLLESLFIEEKLELVLANYVELEREAFNVSLNAMMTHKYDYLSNMDEINIINLKIVNFLSTARLYIDQIKYIIGLIYGDNSNQFKILKDKCSEEYDSNLSYRAMDAIRNHVQHCGLPVRGIIRGNKLIGDEPENYRRKNYI